MKAVRSNLTEDKLIELREARFRLNAAIVLLNQGRKKDAFSAIKLLPEGMQYKFHYGRGKSLLFWLDLEDWGPAKQPTGHSLTPKDFPYTAPLLFETFGDGERWFKSFLAKAVPECCTGYEQNGTFQGLCMVGNKALPSIWAIAVGREQRRRGIARGLLAHSALLLKKSGQKLLRAHVHPDNEASCKLFRNFGFRLVDSSDEFLKMARVGGRVSQGDFSSVHLEPEEIKRACKAEGIEILGNG